MLSNHGASLLLYFKGYVEEFGDIDIMVADTDAIKAEDILKKIGNLKSSSSGKGICKTKLFSELYGENIMFGWGEKIKRRL